MASLALTDPRDPRRYGCCRDVGATGAGSCRSFSVDRHAESIVRRIGVSFEREYSRTLLRRRRWKDPVRRDRGRWRLSRNERRIDRHLRIVTHGRKTTAGHHSVYVVYLRNPNGDGKAGNNVGMTGLTPEERFHNHKAGIKAARVVTKYGERLVPKLYAHLNPMTYRAAQAMEVKLADSLRKRGYLVFGGH